eukprot:EG_transcript_47031
MPAITLTYFPIEGVAEKVRLAFVLGGIPFEDKHVDMADWPKLKPTTKFGQLPVMVVDGREVYQSEAMLRYAAQLCPSLYPAEKALAIDEAIGLANDLLRAWAAPFAIGRKPAALGYPEDFASTDAGQAAIR